MESWGQVLFLNQLPAEFSIGPPASHRVFWRDRSGYMMRRPAKGDLVDDVDRESLIAVVANGMSRFDAKVLAYCITGNHCNFAAAHPTGLSYYRSSVISSRIFTLSASATSCRRRSAAP